MDSENGQPKCELIRLAFLKWLPIYKESKPFQIFTSVPLGVPTTNLVFEEDTIVPVYNIRNVPTTFTLNAHGFQLCKDDSEFSLFDDVGKIEETYLPEVKAMVEKHVEGSDHIVFFDWRVGGICKLSDRPSFRHLKSEVLAADVPSTRYA